MAAIYEKIIKYIDEHIKDEITLEEISKIAGYSSSHIYKIFKYYTSMPIMEYIRRKKLYAAANEFYTGRKLYDIALDYGYETPAGFYKAFQNIFGCSPRQYKNNNNELRSNIFMNIENVKNIEELNEVLEFAGKLYANSSVEIEEDGLYSRKFWIEQFNKNPELLLYAKDGEKVCGIIIGWNDNGNVTVAGDGVLEEYKNKGVHEALFVEIEKRTKKLGYNGIGLGIGEGEEEFYAKLGYTGTMLIQSEKYSVEDMQKFLEDLQKKTNKKYEITGTGIYDGYINQMWLRISILDKEIKETYEKEIGDCWCQIIVGKGI